MIRQRNLRQALDRFQAYEERRLGNGILASIHVAGPGPAAAPEPARVRGCLAMEAPEKCVDMARAGIRGFEACVSDMYPSVYPTLNFGESVWSGLLGAEIEFSGTSQHTWSYCAHPPITDWATFDYPTLSPDNRWLRELLKVNRFFVDQLGPDCDYAPFIFLDCMNLLVELRGATAAYLDLYDHPAEVARFMDWSVSVNEAVYDAQAEILRPAAVAAFGRHPFARYSSACVPNLSVDAYGLCEPGVYERCGLAQHIGIVQRYGGGRLHIHGNGRHLCERVARNRNLSCCQMGDDVGSPPAWTMVDELKRRMHPVPIAVAMPRAEFESGLTAGSLPAGVRYSTTATSTEDAADLMAGVLEYRARQ